MEDQDQDGFQPLKSSDGFQPLAKNNQSLQLGVPNVKGPNSLTDEMLNKSLDFIRPFAGSAAGAGLAALSSPLAALPGGQVIPPLAETQGYAGVDWLLKQLKTNEGGDKGEQLLDSEKDALVNAVSGRIMSGLFRGVGAMRNAATPEIYNFKPTTSQALESYGYHKLATGAKFAEDFGASGAKSEALDRAGGAGFTQALKFSNAINGRQFTVNSDPVKLADKIKDGLEQGLVPNQTGAAPNLRLHSASEEALDVLKGGQNPFAKLDQVIQDPDRLSKVLTASQLNGQVGTNVRQDLQAYHFMKTVNDAMSKDASGATRLDPKKLTDAWTNPEMNTSLNTLYGKKGRADVQEFLQNVATTQDKPMNGGKYIKFVGGGFALGAGMLTDHLQLPGGFYGGVASVYIPSAVIGNLLTKEAPARFLTAAAGAEPLSEGGRLGAKALTNALQGASIALMDSSGKKTWGKIEKDKDGNTTFVENK